MNTLTLSTIDNSHLPETALPENLASLVSPAELVQWTLESVQTHLWSQSDTVLIGGPFNPQALLTVLTYSYAIGVFESEAIVERCVRDDLFRFLSVGIRCAPDRIRVFRGQNCESVRRCLAHVIQHVMDRRAPPGSKMEEDLAEFATRARVLLSHLEARRRFDAAVRADSAFGFEAQEGQAWPYELTVTELPRE